MDQPAREGKKSKKLPLHYLIVVMGTVLLSHAVLALDTCSDTPQYNYSKCLDVSRNVPPTDHYWGALNNCSCCVVNASGDIATLCQYSAYNISNCDRPIGVAIQQKNSGIILKGNASHPIVYNESCKNCCNVGILINNQLEPKWQGSDVTITNVTVKGWANGIMFYKVGPGTGSTITNSTIVENGNGVYLFASQSNNIFSNYIGANSRYGIFLEGSFGGIPKTMHNTIYNNWFNNSNNTGFVGEDVNYWNISETPHSNILGDLGGNYTGGNYWANQTGTGFSENCSCTDKGFCYQSYTLNLDNIDNLPLCKPHFFRLSVKGEIVNWDLHLGYDTIDETSITMNVTTNAPSWYVRAEDAMDLGKPVGTVGHMTDYDPISNTYSSINLTYPIQVKALGSFDYDNLSRKIVECTASPCPKDYNIGVRQYTDYPDVTLGSNHVYRIVIKFVGMSSWL